MASQAAELALLNKQMTMTKNKDKRPFYAKFINESLLEFPIEQMRLITVETSQKKLPFNCPKSVL
uniref:Uncharacterized protein n=1 Tax=Romanomermis culicivorax TaxID=13658 RepID=A0A915HY24_ROMCU